MPPSSPSYQVLQLFHLSKPTACILTVNTWGLNKLSFHSSGEIEKPCVLILVDDVEHEEEEELRLVLGSPKSDSPFGASIGKQNETLIKIKDDGDSTSFVFTHSL